MPLHLFLDWETYSLTHGLDISHWHYCQDSLHGAALEKYSEAEEVKNVTMHVTSYIALPWVNCHNYQKASRCSIRCLPSSIKLYKTQGPFVGPCPIYSWDALQHKK